MPTTPPSGQSRPVRRSPLATCQACSDTAKSLANLQPQSTGLAAVGAVLRRLLPIPGLR
jgi:hypothetical protein